MFSRTKQKYRKKMLRTGYRRTKHGGSMFLAIGGLFLLVTGCALAVLLSVNTGVATFYHEKIGYVALQGATYAANHWPYLPTAQVRQSSVSNMVNGLLTSMGMSSSTPPVVVVTNTTINGQPAVNVSVTVTLPTITAQWAGISPQIPVTNSAEVPFVSADKLCTTAYVLGVDPFGGSCVGYLYSPNNKNPGQPAALPDQNQTVWRMGLFGPLQKIQGP